jgi:pre-mRNA-splicing helicase BRR2
MATDRAAATFSCPSFRQYLQGTEAYDGRSHSHVDYPARTLLHMVGRASKPAPSDSTARAVILCAANRKEILKKTLNDPLPVESRLPGGLHDHINAEVVNRVISSKQDALDYLTWTLLYRRLPQNPNFYNAQGASHRHLSDFLSELVDTTVSDLEASQCIAVADDIDLSALDLGTIAAYYYVSYTTLEVYASSLTAKTKLKGLLEILASSSEFSDLPMRHGEDRLLRQLSAHMPLALPTPPAGREASHFHDPHVKANLLLQAHFSRRSLPAELRADQAKVLESAVTLVQAIVDVISSEGWLKPALAAMELSQMLVQVRFVIDAIKGHALN